MPVPRAVRSPIPFLPVLLALVVGCASYDGAPLAPRSASEFPNREQQKQFFLAAEIPAEAVDVEHTFGRDLREFGILPILVYVQNRSADDFEVRKFSFRVPGVGEFVQVTPQQAAEAARFSQWRSAIWYLFAIFPGFVASAQVAGANEDMEADFRSKQIEPRILESGETKSVPGVLFFAPPAGRSLADIDPKQGLLVVELTRIPPDTGETRAPSEDIEATFVFSRR
ncbi:MAG: hypothetical protein AB7O52_11220 [Planctomycetota bacterium]